MTGLESAIAFRVRFCRTASINSHSGWAVAGRPGEEEGSGDGDACCTIKVLGVLFVRRAAVSADWLVNLFLGSGDRCLCGCIVIGWLGADVPIILRVEY